MPKTSTQPRQTIRLTTDKDDEPATDQQGDQGTTKQSDQDGATTAQ